MGLGHGELPRVRILSLDASALSVPLREPFVIASGRVDATRAALVPPRSIATLIFVLSLT